MKTSKKQSANAITTLPPAPVDERRSRMMKYSLSMLVRLVCIIVAFLVPFGWWTAIPAIGAMVLPYVAVVLANVGAEGTRGTVERPGGMEVYRGGQDIPGYAGASDWEPTTDWQSRPDWAPRPDWEPRADRTPRPGDDLL